MQRRVIIGIILALINAFMLAGMSLFTKLLFSYWQPTEIVFFRNIFSLIFLLIWFIFAGKLTFIKTNRPLIHLLRAIIGTIGILLGAWALSIMPITETTILLFTSPFFVVLLSYPVLKEKVGIYRINAVIVGFIGVVIALNPFSQVNNLPLLGIVLGLSWGFFAASVDICLRFIGKTENSSTTVFYFTLFGSIVTGMHMPFAQIKPDSFSIDAIWIIIFLGITGLLSLLAKTQSFRLAEASIISPIMYSMIIWSMAFDYIFWGKEPTINMIIGTIIIITSNIFILHRESIAKKIH